MRGRAVVARRAHNPEVIGSNPVPATKTKRETPVFLSLFFPQSVFLPLGLVLSNLRPEINEYPKEVLISLSSLCICVLIFTNFATQID